MGYNQSEAVAAIVLKSYCTVHAPLSTDAFLRLGTDDTNVVWLNGERLHEFSEERGIVMDNDIVPLKLKAGENTLLIKIGQGTGPWKFIPELLTQKAKRSKVSIQSRSLQRERRKNERQTSTDIATLR